LAANIILRVPDDASNAAARADEAAAITDKAPAAEAASTGETIATARGKSAHSSFATGRRESGDFSLVNAPFRDANGHPLQLPKRVDLLNGTPAPNTSLGTVRPDAVRFSNGVIVEDKPLGRALSKDRQQIIRYINGYQQARGELPARVGIQRYDPTTGEPVMTELHSPFDFLPKD
jgi:hypothetical protein